jgi:hypothetical protein
MKKILLSLSVLLITIQVIAQEGRTITNPEVIQGVLIKITPPLSEFKPGSTWIDEQVRDENGVIKENKENVEHRNGGHPAVDPNALPKGDDPVWQKSFYSKKRANSILQNFDGQGYTNVNPADPSLCVGPNHVIQMINGSSGARMAIYSKTGTVIQAAQYMDAISGIPGLGDPIAMYDQFADRFVISEFSASGNKLVVMVSQTANPTGSWYIYQFTAPEFPDYPKYGIWPNAYICTTNESNNKVYAMNRPLMLAGTPVVTMLSFTITALETIGFQAAAPVNISGTTLPPAGTNPMLLRMVDDAWTSAPADVDRLEMWTMNLDFVTPANSSLSQQADINTAVFTSDLCGYSTLNCIRQPGTTRMDPIREIIMNRVYYRNFGTHQSLVALHSVDPGVLDRAGCRWYEMRRTGLGAWSMFQQGTYAPDTNSRWMGTMAINNAGTIGMMYNVSSKAVFPSIRFTGRISSDPLGTMTEPEQTIVAGAATNGSNRWGDYNDMQVDPSDDETFWTTGMYRPTGSGWSTRISSFSISQFALPLSLLSFDGKRINDKEINLNWNVENENNVARYEIERQEDNDNYKMIASIPYKHHTQSTNEYTFTDVTFNALATKEYRLKMIDQDGKYRYSNTVTISGKASQSIEIYPNPVIHDVLYIRINEATVSKKLSFVIYNQNAQKVIQQEKELLNVNQIQSIDLSALSSGLYYLSVLDAQGNIISKEKITKK